MDKPTPKISGCRELGRQEIDPEGTDMHLPVGA